MFDCSSPFLSSLQSREGVAKSLLSPPLSPPPPVCAAQRTRGKRPPFFLLLPFPSISRGHASTARASGSDLFSPLPFSCHHLSVKKAEALFPPFSSSDAAGPMCKLICGGIFIFFFFFLSLPRPEKDRPVPFSCRGRYRVFFCGNIRRPLPRPLFPFPPFFPFTPPYQLGGRSDGPRSVFPPFPPQTNRRKLGGRGSPLFSPLFFFLPFFPRGRFPIAK